MKKGNYILMIVVPLLIVSTIRCTYYTNPGPEDIVIPPPAPAYIGSESCAGCHQEKFSTFSETGHPYVHSEVVEGTAPVYPFTIIDYLPPFFQNGWNDPTYVVGGFAWKYNLTDQDGYLYTGNDAQYNFADQSVVPFHENEAPGTKKFDCGKCHTTGWTSVADGGTPHNDLPGMDGEFALAGVQCEACHGMGSVHASSRDKADIVIPREAADCGQCHSRNGGTSIAAGEGFVKHNAQFDEMSATAHASLDNGCAACHNPHITVKHDQMGGIKEGGACLDCHEGINNPTHSGADCITCHMSYVTKSAVTTNKYVADMKTHIFKINPAADGKLFNDEGTIANGESGVTLDFVCYQCHRDQDGVGGSNSSKTMEQLSARATGFHD